MTSDDIIRMAREAGAMSEHMAWLERDLFPVFASFANLVAAAEREACAKVCEQAGIDGYGTLATAAMIRARREK